MTSIVKNAASSIKTASKQSGPTLLMSFPTWDTTNEF